MMGRFNMFRRIPAVWMKLWSWFSLPRLLWSALDALGACLGVVVKLLSAGLVYLYMVVLMAPRAEVKADLVGVVRGAIVHPHPQPIPIAVTLALAFAVALLNAYVDRSLREQHQHRLIRLGYRPDSACRRPGQRVGL